MFCSHGRLFKQALNQDWAVKRAYTVYVVDVARGIAVLLGLESVFNQNSDEKILSVTYALIRFYSFAM